MNELSRRRFLGSLGLGAGAALLGPVASRLTSEAKAVENAPRRFVLFGAHGFTHQWWRPKEHPVMLSGEQLVLKSDAYTLAPMFEPLAKYQADMLLLDGLIHDCRAVGGEIQHGGHFAAFTCRPKLYSPDGASFDQYVAPMLSKQAPQPSLLLGMWGKAPATKQTLETTTFAAGKDRPLPHFVNANAMLQAVFGMTTPVSAGPDLTELKEIRLRDVLRADLKRLNDRLPGPERQRLDLYAAAVEDYDRRRQLRAAIRCDGPTGASGNATQAHFEAMFDLAILGLKCGMTNVVGVAVGTGGQPHHNDHMPVYEDIGEVGSHGWNADNLLAMHRYHTGLIERLWTELINTPSPSGSGTLADETVVMYSPTNGFTGDTSHHSNSFGAKNRAEWAAMLLSRVPGLRRAGDYVHFNDKVRARTVAEMFHGLAQPLGIDPSGFGKGSNGDGDFHSPLEDLLA